MSWVWATAVVAGFAAVLEGVGLPGRAAEVAGRARECLSVLRDPALSDDQKEAALRRHAARLFVLLGILVGGSALALGLPLAAVWAVDQAGLASFPTVWATLQRLDFLAAVSVAGVVLWLFFRQRRRRNRE